MKHKILPVMATIMLTLFAFNSLQAQIPFYNEWIDFDKTYYEIKVVDNQIYKIPYDVLQEKGLGNAKGADFKMMYQGKEVPLYVSTDDDMTESDYITFYGQKNNGAYDWQLYLLAEHQTNPNVSLFNDTANYFLYVDENGIPKRYQDIPNIEENLPAEEYVYSHIREDYNLGFFRGNNIYVDNSFYPIPLHEEAECFLDGITFNPNDPVIKTFQLSGLYGNGGDVEIFTRMVGMTNVPDNFPDHKIKVKINNTLVADTVFDGLKTIDFHFNIPANDFVSTQELNLEFVASEEEIALDYNTVSFVDIRYPAKIDAQGLTAYELFTSYDKNSLLKLQNFTFAAKVYMYDLTADTRMEATENNLSELLFYTNTDTNKPNMHQCRIVNEDDFIITSDNLTPYQFRDFKKTENQGSFIILYNSSLLESTLKYKEYRESEEGGNYQVILVNIDELYKQNAWGISNNAFCIQRFVNHALKDWTVKPEYILVLGKSVTYDNTRWNETAFQQNLIPAFGYPPSDNVLTSISPFHTEPQIACGRIPASTNEEVLNYLDKVKVHEAGLRGETTYGSQEWRDTLMFVHYEEVGNTGELWQSNYEEYALQTANATYAAKENIFIQFTKYSNGVQHFFNQGASLVHLTAAQKPQDWFVHYDLSDLNNTNHYPFILSSCYGDMDMHNLPQSSANFIEQILLAKEKGAIAYYGNTALVRPFDDIQYHAFNKAFYQKLSQDNYGQPIGKILLELHQELSFKQLETYNLAGDPSLVIRSTQLPVGMQDSKPDIKPSVSIYPNPIQQGQTLVFNHTREIEQILLYNIHGTKIFSRSNKNKQDKLTWNLSAFINQGCYICILENRVGEKEVMKVMVY